MGKARKDRKHTAAARVLAEPTSTVTSAAQAAQLIQASAQTIDKEQTSQIIEKLTSSSPVQQAVACSGLAHIIANQLRPPTSLVTLPLLRALLPLLLEKNAYDVAISAAGAVRNMSAIGSGTEDPLARNAMQQLLNSDACSIIISMLEPERTAWMLSLPAAHSHNPTASSSAAASTSTDLAGATQPLTGGDKRAHFLAQLVSALSNLVEQFDVVSNYFMSNSKALAHLIMLLLDDATAAGQTQPSSPSASSPSSFLTPHVLSLHIEISNLLLLVSESNPDFIRSFARMPPEISSVLVGNASSNVPEPVHVDPNQVAQMIVQKLLLRLDPASPTTFHPNAQVRAHLAGTLLNMQPSGVLMSLSSSASASLVLPGTTPTQTTASPPPPVSCEQMVVTGAISTLSTLLDSDPLTFTQQLVDSLGQDRKQLDATLAEVAAKRALEDEAYQKQAAMRHAAKIAAKKAASSASAAAAVASGSASMDAIDGPDDENQMVDDDNDDDDAGMTESKQNGVASPTDAASSTVSAAHIPNDSDASLIRAHHAQASSSASSTSDPIFADAHDLLESRHKDATGSVFGSAASTGSSSKSPEVLLASQWGLHIERRLVELRSVLNSVKIGLEIITNLCSVGGGGGDDGAEDEAMDNMSDSDSDSGSGSGMTSGTNLDAKQLGYIPKLILHTNIIEKLVRLCHVHLHPEWVNGGTATSPSNGSTATSPVPASPHAALLTSLHSIYPSDEVNSRIVDLLDSIRHRAQSALTNLVLFLPKEVLLMVPGSTASSSHPQSPPQSQLAAIFTHTLSLLDSLSAPFQAGTNLAVIDEVASLVSLLFQGCSKDSSILTGAGAGGCIDKSMISRLVGWIRTERKSLPPHISTSGPTALPPSILNMLPKGHTAVQLPAIELLGIIGALPASHAFNFILGSVLLEVIKSTAHVIQACQNGVSGVSGSVLLTRLMFVDPSTSDHPHFIEVTSECMNALIDLYSEDDLHVDTQKSIQLIPVLDQAFPLIQAGVRMVAAQRNPRVDRAIVARLQENVLNMREFIKYKKQHLR